MSETCPACGYENGDRNKCACCGFSPDANDSAAEWRRRWKACGMPWSSMMVPQPEAWDPTRQLSGVEDKDR